VREPTLSALLAAEQLHDRERIRGQTVDAQVHELVHPFGVIHAVQATTSKRLSSSQRALDVESALADRDAVDQPDELGVASQFRRGSPDWEGSGS